MAYNLLTELRNIRKDTRLIHIDSVPAIESAIALLNDVHQALDRKEWNADTCQTVATLLGLYGLECRDVSDETGLTAAELAEKHGKCGHPEHSLGLWAAAAGQARTLLGYWDWVVTQVNKT